jgi:hypothetical protein
MLIYNLNSLNNNRKLTSFLIVNLKCEHYMERLSTLKNSENSFNHENNQKEQTQLEEVQFEPSEESVQFLLNYSKALSATKTKSLGDVFTVLN